MQSATNILLEGIRGTGKTHILKMIREEALSTFKEERILPVYLSLARLSEYEHLEETRFRIYLYTSIVQGAIDSIKSNIETIERADDPLHLKLLKSNAPFLELFQERPFGEVLQVIHDLFNRLSQELLSGDLTIVEDKSKDLKGSFSWKLLSASTETTKKEQFEYVLDRLSHNNASRYIIDFFKGLFDILELSYSLLLLDEISGVSDQAQIEVFRLLRLIRASTEIEGKGFNFLYFIGSVYPPQKTNYPARANGLDFDFIAGEDCSMEYLEMDVLNEEYEAFFSYMTERRLAELHPESEGKLLWLYEDEKTFFLAAFAAHGLPRRYFEIIKVAYSIASKKHSPNSGVGRIDYSSVSQAIQLIVDNQTLNESQLTDADFHYLDRNIIPKLSARNSGAETRNESREEDKRLPVHVFLNVTRTDRRKLGNLIYRGVIHNLSRTRKAKYTANPESEQKGIMLMLDLSVAFNYRVFNIQRAVEYFQIDLRENASRGYLYYSEITLTDPSET